MDAEAVILLRFAERILAVAIGGFAIYLGYRLFSKVPDARDGEGRLSLTKDIRIVVSRVGPGVFFALFGAAAVALSLYSPVTLSIGGDLAFQGSPHAGAVHTFSGAGTMAADADRDARTDTRRVLRREIAFLNTLPRMLDPDLPAVDQRHAALSIERIKLALMKPVWGEPTEGWGTPEAFERWLDEGAPENPPEAIGEAVRYFNHPVSENRP